MVYVRKSVHVDGIIDLERQGGTELQVSWYRTRQETIFQRFQSSNVGQG